MGLGGTIFMAVLIYLACTVTAVGLTSATATLFSQMSGISYKILLPVVVFLSFLIANFGLTRLIDISVPALSIVCPACTVLILLQLFKFPARNIALPVWISIVYSFYYAVLKPFGFSVNALDVLPLGDYALGWVLPTLVLAVFYWIKEKRAASLNAAA